MARNLIYIFLLGLFFSACGSKNSQKELTAKSHKSAKSIENYFLIDTSFTDLENTIGVNKLGDVNSGEVLKGSFFVKNGTSEALVILNVNGFCGCLNFDYNKKPFKSGEIKEITYTFDTKQKKGFQLSPIKIETNLDNYTVRFESNIR